MIDVPLDTLKDFLAEAGEITDKVTRSLSCLPSAGEEIPWVDALYRDIHTLKGGAFLLGFKQIGQLSHAMESCLEPVRSGDLLLDDNKTDALLLCIDALNQILSVVASQNKEGDQSAVLDELIPKLVMVFAGELTVSRQSMPVDSPSQGRSSATASSSAPRLSSSGERGDSSRSVVALDWDASQTVRVGLDVLDKLMSHVSELVVVRNELLLYSSRADNAELFSMINRLHAVTSLMQKEVTCTRLQPVGILLNRFKRMVNDLARELKKQVNCEIFGADTELDKAQIERIRDPLTHLIRNALDHAIETPAERQAAQKPLPARVTLGAWHEGSQVVVCVEDDGRGFDPRRIRQKAIDTGLVSAEVAATLDDDQVLSFVFAPGFSTASQVTGISGRGVGLDVVKSNAEALGGTVAITSVCGKGSRILLRIPLSTAVIPALAVRVGEHTFLCPQEKIAEIKILAGDVGVLAQSNGDVVLDLRGEVIPARYLSHVFKIPQADCPGYFVVVHHHQQKCAFIVDSVLDTMEIVVNPLPPLVGASPFFSGVTLTGQGQPAVILDVLALAAQLLSVPSAGGVLLENVAKEVFQKKIHGTQSQGEQDEDNPFLLLRSLSGAGIVIAAHDIFKVQRVSLESVQFMGDRPVFAFDCGDQKEAVLVPLLHECALFCDAHQVSCAHSYYDESCAVVILKTARGLMGLVFSGIGEMTTVNSSTLRQKNTVQIKRGNRKLQLIDLPCEPVLVLTADDVVAVSETWDPLGADAAFVLPFLRQGQFAQAVGA